MCLKPQSSWQSFPREFCFLKVEAAWYWNCFAQIGHSIIKGNGKTTQPMQDTCLGRGAEETAGWKATCQCTSCPLPWLPLVNHSTRKMNADRLSLHVGMPTHVHGQRLHSKKTHGPTGCYSGTKHQLKSERLREEALALPNSLLEMHIHGPKVLNQNQWKRG